MKSQIRKVGSRFYVTSGEGDVIGKLEPGNYTVKYSKRDEVFYLEKIQDFTYPKEIWGDLEGKAEKFISAFEDRSKNVGVLLCGEKGSGKSLLSQLTCIRAKEKRQMPTIVISEGFHQQGFVAFLQSFNQEVVLFFDEFEKMYTKYGETEEARQDSLLGLFDGQGGSKRLILLTANNDEYIDDKYKNRPGRVLYYLNFHRVEKEVVTEYCQKHLMDQERVSEVELVSDLIINFNFDALTELVREMNRLDISAEQAVADMNLRLDDGDGGRFKATVRINNNDLLRASSIYPENSGHSSKPVKPLSENFIVNVSNGMGIEDKILVKPEYCVEINNGEFTFEFTEHGIKYEIVLYREQNIFKRELQEVLSLRTRG